MWAQWTATLSSPSQSRLQVKGLETESKYFLISLEGQALTQSPENHRRTAETEQKGGCADPGGGGGGGRAGSCAAGLGLGTGGAAGAGCPGAALEVTVSWAHAVPKTEVPRHRRSRPLSREGPRRGVRTLGLVLVLSGHTGQVLPLCISMSRGRTSKGGFGKQ